MNDDKVYRQDAEEELEMMIEEEVDTFGFPDFEEWGACPEAYFELGVLMSKEEYVDYQKNKDNVTCPIPDEEMPF